MVKAQIGVIGMAVMGRNLALNLASRGFSVAVYNRTASVTEEVIEGNPGSQLIGFVTLTDFVAALERPRKMILMVKAGAPVDATIDQLVALLEPGDIVIDGGNSFFRDSQRRYENLKKKGFHFVGLGVSGGETGARKGPALMPGCDPEVYELLAPYLNAMAAKAEDGVPCAARLGAGGAGHYVKMVHNGIEYADMEQIAETYQVLRRLGGFSNAEQKALFSKWNCGLLSSYLIEITANILGVPDDQGQPGELVDYIADVALQKGTGKWTNLEAVDLGVDASVLAAGLNARVMSMLKTERTAAAVVFTDTAVAADAAVLTTEEDKEALAQDAMSALLATKIIAYAQGFKLYKEAAAAYGWKLRYDVIAQSFRAGCIIRSTLLNPMMEAFRKNQELPNLMMDDYFAGLLREHIHGLRRFVTAAVTAGIPVPAMMAALAYFDTYRTEQGAANLIQAQRDYFGAHTFERTDRAGSFHYQWE
ncbi:MAG: decarboxylating NADP(+)-dependent phosphogluconate dehydrogenase [Lachnospiraceae bacterium]|nr:decarboxylating NADP(+)-dependent phosphogluconate dehydrogenase [Lachnospiraceae bacterium]MDY5742922.1 decarboxylating NADP(+)-dependent phosphogluconate dehydrogenase [Lachnospiraceae bacterium]